jgi:hypothetical protein
MAHLQSYTIEDLNALAESDAWVGNADLVSDIYEAYVQYTTNVAPYRHFGSELFWGAVLGEDFLADVLRPQQGGHVGSNYTIADGGTIDVKRFKTKGQTLKLQFDGHSNKDTVSKAISESIQRAFQNDGRVGVEIQHSALEKPILIPFTNKAKLDAFTILNVIEAVQNSKQLLTFDGDLVFTFTTVK